MVSVVVPLYNKAPYIRRCLESICAQSFSDLEVLVVNDGSRDGSETVAEEVRDARVRLISQENAGPGAARNRGLAEAQGEYVAFLDADDEWHPEYLAKSLEALADGRAVCTTCCYEEEPPGRDLQEFWQQRGIAEQLFRVTAQTEAQLLLYMVAYMLPCSTVSRTEAIRALGGFYERGRCMYAEDAFLWTAVLLNHAVAFRLDPLVRIHRDAAELSKNLRGCRPIEPFLEHPEEIQRLCPDELRPLLDRFLAMRAFKTACVLGYWGQWREAKRIRDRFSRGGDWSLPYAMPSLVCATPLGAWMGAALRTLRAA